MTRRRRRRYVRCAAVAVAVVAASSLAGCTAGRSELGTGSSSCYLAIPKAVTAVHGEGHLAGLLLRSVASLKSTGLLYDPAHSARVPRVCLVAFTGRFTARRVQRPVGHGTGRLAVVELAYPNGRVLVTLIAHHLPLPFGHTHIGLP